MTEEKILESQTFKCGCKVICEVIEGENTVTLEACENPTCFIRTYVMEESVRQGKEPVIGYKDVVN